MSLDCAQAKLCFGDLLAGSLAPAAAQELDKHLATCEACHRHARAVFRLDRGLHELAAIEQATAVAAGVRTALTREQPTRSKRVAAGWLLAAAVLLLAVTATLWLAHPDAEQGIARLESVDGEVYVMIGGRRARAAVGQVIRSGQGVQTIGEESGATVIDRQGGRIVIGPDSMLGALSAPANQADAAGNRIAFVSGSLSTDSTGMGESKPMVVDTPQARLVSRGARLSLVNTPEATRVELEAGSARMTRRSDGHSVELAAGTFSIVRAEADPFEPQPLPSSYTKPRANLPADPLRIWALAFAPAGNASAMISAGSQGRVCRWDPKQGADQTPRIITDTLQENVRALAFSRDGRVLAAGGDNPPRTRVWMDDKPGFDLLGHRTWIEALAFSADGRTLVVAGAHGQQSSQIHLWDLESRKVRTILDGHAGGTWCVTFSPDGNTLASSGRDGVIKLWNMQDLQAAPRLLHGHTSEIYAVAFSPDGLKLASSSRDKTVRVWDLAAGQELHCLLGHSKEVRALAYAPDGRTIASGASDGTARLWRVSDGQELATFKLMGSANTIAFSPDGRTLACGGWSKIVQLWDLPADGPQ